MTEITRCTKREFAKSEAFDYIEKFVRGQIAAYYLTRPVEAERVLLDIADRFDACLKGLPE